MYVYQDYRLTLNWTEFYEIPKSYNFNKDHFFQAVYCAVLGAYDKKSFILNVSGYNENNKVYIIDLDLDVSLLRFINKMSGYSKSDQKDKPELDYEFLESYYFAYHEKKDEIEKTKITFPLSVILAQYSDDGIFVRYYYDDTKFDGNWVKVFHLHYQAALSDAVKNIDKPLKELRIISDYEREVIAQANQTEHAFSADKCVHEVIEGVADRLPNAIALECDDRQVSYRELVERINALAGCIRRQGIGAGDYVAIASERGIPLICSIFAIMKAGAAYVPISLKNPPERINYILEECSPKLILTTAPSVFADTDVKLIDITKESVFEKTDHPFPALSDPSDVAALIYTSGTTGVPKGILVCHNTIVNYCEYNLREFEINENDIITQFAPFSFSASIYEIATTLFAGGKLCLVKDETIADITEFHKYVTEKQVTIMLLPPDYAKYITPPATVRIIETAASLCNTETSDKIREKTRHVNAYGLTESSTVTVWKGLTEKSLRRVPIGKPVSNTQVVVVKDGKPCGMYMPGELWVTGLALAKGYFNLPELNRERYVPNPFGSGIMLRTGDLVQWNYDGELEYLGRSDNQVQIRGMRVELEEIEHMLLKHECIHNAAVICKEDMQGDNILIAFIAGRQEIDIHLLKEQLVKSMVSYMVPSHIVQIDEIPLTINGKVDKKALHKIPVERTTPYIAPQGEAEQDIAAIFEDILQIKQVGRNDNFFEIGGHSLRAARLLNLLEIRYGIRLSIKNIFDKPTVAEIAELIDSLEPQKYVPLKKAQKQEHYVLSPAQRRLYMLQEIDSVGTAYNITAGLNLKGKLDLERVRESFNKLIARHEILRTVFKIYSGEIVQEILPEVKAVVEYEKNRDMTEADKSRALNKFMRPFNLEQAPLMRVKIVETEPEEFLLLLDIHHIITDGSSMNLLLEEFTSIYNGGLLPELELQYKDYSQWLDKRDLSDKADYWQKEFADGGTVLELVTDFPRPQFQSFRGRAVEGKVDPSLKKQLQQLCRENGVTEYMVLLASAQVLLHKYSGQEDITMGSPISGRTRQHMERMLGMFVNTLAMRGYPAGEKSFKELLQEVKESCLKAYENQEYAFEDLVEMAGGKRDLARNPLFDVMLAFQNNDKAELKLKGLTAEEILPEESTARFDLTLNIWEMDQEYRLEFEYCADLFKQETVTQMVNHYIEILQAIVENADQKISDIPMLSADEKEKILSEFNNTAAKYPEDKTIVELFEAQSARTPDNIALVYGNGHFTYRQLNENANSLAYKLQELGVRPGDFVVLIGEKSIELITGILGIVKSGGVYVPIDTAYPAERINYIIEDCNPKVILTYNAAINTERPVIDLNERMEWKPDNLNIMLSPCDLIYMIYTSGTTGKPKGVMVEHRNVVKLVRNTDYVTLDESTCILQTGAISFDASTFELWGAFLNGGKVILADKEILGSPILLKEAINKNGVNTMFITTALFNQMVSMDNSVFSQLKYLMFGGEKTSEEYVQKFIECASNRGVKFSNIYGPTEATTFSLYYPVSFENPAHKTPIGKPISNTKAYILKGDNLCGIGVPGELCIAGSGITRGYLNLPELTAEKFIADPYGKGRLYRSGDLARWLPDGNIEYLGRIDNQVKIHGFRIELEEIEAVLRSMNIINNAAVVMQDDVTGEAALHAYLTGEEKIDLSYVDEALRQKLPDYMVPVYMMQIETIPLNNSGKVNRQALPKIEIKSAADYQSPRNETEAALVKVFEEVLGVKPVGIKDNFFYLGGHSLRATRTVSRIEEITGVRIALKTFFLRPTVEGLAAIVEEKQEYTPIPKAPEQNCYTLIPEQRRFYLMQMLCDLGTCYNIPAGLKFSGQLDLERVKDAYCQLLERHEILRTALKMHCGLAVMEVIPMEDIEPQVEYEKVWGLTRDELNRKLDQFVRPFQMDKPPTLRIKVFNTGPEESYLLLDIHHSVCDGASLNIILTQFGQLYNGETLEKQELQYKDYSQWYNSLDFSIQKAYWENEYADGGPVVDIPTDYPRTKQSFKCDMINERVDAKLRKALEAFGREHDLTDYMIFMTATYILLHKYSGQEDVTVASPFSCRTHRDTEKILGMFVNTVIIRAFPVKEKRIKDFLFEVKQKCIEAYEYQQYPSANLIESIAGKRDLKRNPLFDFMLELQNNESIDMELRDVKVVGARELFIDERAKFDWTMNITGAEGEYNLELGYCTDLFKRETAATLLNNYIEILCTIIENPSKKIGDITIDDAMTVTNHITSV